MQTLRRIGIYSGIIAPWWWAGMIVLCASLWPQHYDHTQQFISELGAHGSPTQTLMVWGGFYVTGVLYALFGIALMLVHERQRLAQAAGLVILFAGLTRLGTGYFPCEAGCNALPGSIDHVWHHIFARIGYACLTLATLLWGLSCRQQHARGFAIYSFVTVAITIVLLALLQHSIEPRTNTGLYQRLVTLSLSSWIFVLACIELRKTQTQYT